MSKPDSASSHIDKTAAPSGTGCVECDATQRLVGAPAPLRAVRAHRLL